MAFHSSIEDALDEIDAMVFSGDALLDPDNLNNFREFLARWERGSNTMEEISSDD